MMDRNQGFGGEGGGATSGPETRDFVFGYVISGPSTRPFYLGGGGRDNTELDQKQDFFGFPGNITNGPETRRFVFGGAGGTKTRLWRQLDSRNPKMQVAPGWPFSAEIWRHVHLYPHLETASSTRVLPKYSGGKN
jgi:hypothetical protein